MASEEELKFYEVYLKRSLNLMERWLGETEYLCGNEKTIADISAAHELDNTKFASYDLSKWPKVEAWLHKMIDEDPVQLKIATVMRKLAASFVKSHQ